MKLSLLVASAIAAACLASAARAENFSTNVSSNWSESWTDAAGNYNSPASNTTVSGGMLVAPIPTDASQALLNKNGTLDNDVVNYVRTRTDIGTASTDYAGSLLGNLGGKTALTATFSLNNSKLGAGVQFDASQFVGELAPGNSNPQQQLRFVFTGTAPDLTDDSSGNTPSIWWSNPGVVYPTSMQNGVAVAMTVNFDPSQWSNYDGHEANTSAAYTADFLAALSDVKNLGLSFGSGYFFSDGFAFNTGGTASLNLVSIDTIGNSPDTQAVPVPAAVWGGGVLLSLLAGGRIIRRKRQA